MIVEGGKGRMEPAANTPAEVTLHCNRTSPPVPGPTLVMKKVMATLALHDEFLLFGF
jgi:hypothetical protein